jgi:lipoprotein-releasing system permease protein
MTRFEWLVARRYLRSSNRPFLLRLVTLLSVLGIAAGVSTLVIALAMNTGFRQAIRDRLLGVTAHINVKPVSSGGVSDYEALIRWIAAVPGVRAVAPALYDTVLLSGGGRARGVVLKGMDPELERKSDEALRRIVAGGANFSADADGIPAVLIGQILSADLKITAGDYITLTSPQGSLTPFGMIPRSRRFRVAGVFDSGFYDYDANWVFVTLSTAQSLGGVGDVAGLLEVRVDKLDDVDAMARTILASAGAGYTVTTWKDENQALFRALSLEKLVTAIFVGLITFVAGLNVLVVLTMTVTDRAKDIAVLMSMGARGRQIRNIFVLQGLAVGAAGTGIGLLVGYMFAILANRWRLIPLNPEVYAIPYVPFHVGIGDGVWVAGAALLISVAATLYPAGTAARILPVEILRYE